MTSRYHPYRHRRPRYRGKSVSTKPIRPAGMSRRDFRKCPKVEDLLGRILWMDMHLSRILTAYWKRALIREALTPLDTPG